MILAAYNRRTLKLEIELDKIRWLILGLSEVGREGEDAVTLESGHLLYFQEASVFPRVVSDFLSTKPSDNDVEEMDFSTKKAIKPCTRTSGNHFNVVIGDFNAKVELRTDTELFMGQYGIGSRNHRRQILNIFFEREELFSMNSFFKMKLQRKWTWRSAENVTNNEIHFIMTNKRYVFRDLLVINRFFFFFKDKYKKG